MADETPDNSADGPAEPEAPETAPEPDESADTFPRSYVEKLRAEAKDNRTAAAAATERADSLAQRLHAALVTATGRLADASDLPFDAAHLDDEGALSAAIDDLLSRKPHLASRRPRGDVDQGARGQAPSARSLGAILRGES